MATDCGTSKVGELDPSFAQAKFNAAQVENKRRRKAKIPFEQCHHIANGKRCGKQQYGKYCGTRGHNPGEEGQENGGFADSDQTGGGDEIGG